MENFKFNNCSFLAVFVIFNILNFCFINAGVIKRREIASSSPTTTTSLTLLNGPSENVTRSTKLIPQKLQPISEEKIITNKPELDESIKKTTLKLVDNIMTTSDIGVSSNIKENFIENGENSKLENMETTTTTTTMSNSIDGQPQFKNTKDSIDITTQKDITTKESISKEQEFERVKGFTEKIEPETESTKFNLNNQESSKDLDQYDKKSTTEEKTEKMNFDALLHKNISDTFESTTKSLLEHSIELSLDGSNEIHAIDSSSKQPKFLNDNSTNANQLNLPNTAEVWTLAGMKSVPTRSNYNQKLQPEKLDVPENNSTPNPIKEKSVTDWSQIVQNEVAKSVGNALTEDQTFEDETTSESNIKSTKIIAKTGEEAPIIKITSTITTEFPNELPTTTTKTTATTMRMLRTTTLTPTFLVDAETTLSPIDNVDTMSTNRTLNIQTLTGESAQESKENDVKTKMNEEFKATSSTISSSTDSSSTSTATATISTPTIALESTTQSAIEHRTQVVGISDGILVANKLDTGNVTVAINDNRIETTTTTFGTDIDLSSVASTTVRPTSKPTKLVTNVKKVINFTPSSPDVNQIGTKSNLATPTTTTTTTTIESIAAIETTTPSTNVHRTNSSAIVNQISKLKDDDVTVRLDSFSEQQSTSTVEFVTSTPTIKTTVATVTNPKVTTTKDFKGVTVIEQESTTTTAYNTKINQDKSEDLNTTSSTSTTTITTTTSTPLINQDKSVDTNEGTTTETSTTTKNFTTDIKFPATTSITPNSTSSETTIVEYKVSTEETKIETTPTTPLTTTIIDAKSNFTEMTTTLPSIKSTSSSTESTSTIIETTTTSSTTSTTPTPTTPNTTAEIPLETTIVNVPISTTTISTITTTTPPPTTTKAIEMVPTIIHSTQSTSPPESSTLNPLIIQSAVGILRPQSPKSSPENPETDVNVVIAISVSVIGVVALILLVAFLYLMRKRQKQTAYGARCRPANPDAYSLDNVSVFGGSVRRKGALRASKRTYGNAAFDDPSLRHNVLQSAAELSKFIERRSSIFDEFRDVPQIIARREEIPPGCEDKNRYANVIPLPETRVILQRQNDDDTTEYINANYVRGPNDSPNYYIACQAPSDKTIQDFWRMIWEQQSRVIIQATDLIENGVEKCAEYLPPSVTLDNHTTFGNFQVTLKNREVKDKYAISTIMLKNIANNDSREITHYWYKWPETGVPSEEAPIIAMLLEARSSLKSYAIELMNDLKEKGNTISSTGETQTSLTITNGSGTSSKEINANVSEKSKNILKNQGPLTIHCSPGTGRTGTIISIDMAIRSLETKKSLDIPQIVYYVRRGRASAVQTKEQYEFIYKVANVYAMKITNVANEN